MWSHSGDVLQCQNGQFVDLYLCSLGCTNSSAQTGGIFLGDSAWLCGHSVWPIFQSCSWPWGYHQTAVGLVWSTNRVLSMYFFNLALLPLVWASLPCGVAILFLLIETIWPGKSWFFSIHPSWLGLVVFYELLYLVACDWPMGKLHIVVGGWRQMPTNPMNLFGLLECFVVSIKGSVFPSLYRNTHYCILHGKFIVVPHFRV